MGDMAGAIPRGSMAVDAERLSTKDTFMTSVTNDRHEAVPHVTEFVAGYASAATHAAYRSDLTL